MCKQDNKETIPVIDQVFGLDRLGSPLPTPVPEVITSGFIAVLYSVLDEETGDIDLLTLLTVGRMSDMDREAVRLTSEQSDGRRIRSVTEYSFHDKRKGK